MQLASSQELNLSCKVSGKNHNAIRGSTVSPTISSPMALPLDMALQLASYFLPLEKLPPWMGDSRVILTCIQVGREVRGKKRRERKGIVKLLNRELF